MKQICHFLIATIFTKKLLEFYSKYSHDKKRFMTLLHKPYRNRVTLSNEIDLLNEVLNIDFSQGAAKISKVKVGVRKKYLPISPVRTHALTALT